MKTTDLWAGEFGNAYLERNRVEWRARVPFWESAMQFTEAASVIEVGANAGWNLLAIHSIAPDVDLKGIDINQSAVEEARQQGLDVQHSTALGLHGLYGSAAADLVFTAGVLIHIAPADLEPTMRMIADTSARYVLAVEYHEQDGEVEVEYRGQAGALWRRNYGELYQNLGLTLLSVGEAGGFDACTYYLLEKAAS